MNDVFIILFKVRSGDRVYDCISNYYFNSEKDARAYACHFIAESCNIYVFEIKKLMPHFN